MERVAAIGWDEAAREPMRTSMRDVLAAELPGIHMGDRLLLRAVALAARLHIRSVTGAARIMGGSDPFILVLNHNSRREALLVPALLILLRGGRRIHFLADWNFRMIPGVDLIYRRAGAITVPNKPARPRVLNVLKPLFTDREPPMERARACLRAGSPIGIFPEGTVNRDPARLRRGRLGAARLAIETGVLVLPAGLRWVTPPGEAPLAGGPMDLVIGEPLLPPPADAVSSPDAVRAWHARIMSAIGTLSGKVPRLPAQEVPHEGF